MGNEEKFLKAEVLNIFLPLARSEVAIWTPKQVFNILKLLGSSSVSEQKTQRSSTGSLQHSVSCHREIKLLKTSTSGGTGAPRDVQPCMARLGLVGLMVQSHEDLWPPQLAGSSTGDPGCLHGPFGLLLLLLHHHSMAPPPASPLLLALARWLWHLHSCLKGKTHPLPASPKMLSHGMSLTTSSHVALIPPSKRARGGAVTAEEGWVRIFGWGAGKPDAQMVPDLFELALAPRVTGRDRWGLAAVPGSAERAAALPKEELVLLGTAAALGQKRKL